MSAEVYRNPWGACVGYCRECNENIAGAPSMVELWADVHNSDNHRSHAAPEQELADDFDRNDRR